MHEALVRELASRDGLDRSHVEVHDSLGYDNHIWFLGDDLVFRTPRNEEAAVYMRGEIEGWRFAHAGGVKTPEVVAAGNRDDGAPYMFVQRMPGLLLGHTDPRANFDLLIEDLAEQLAILHSLTAAHRHDLRRPYDHFDPIPSLALDHERGIFSRDEAALIGTYLERLMTYPGNFRGDEVGEFRHSVRDVFTHNDLHPWNILVEGNPPRLAGIIDWGDSCVSDRRNDLCTMPLPLQIRLIDAYRDRVRDVGEAFEARILWAWLDMALYEVRGLPNRGYERAWWRWPPGGWEEFQAQIAAAPTAWQL